MILVLSKISIQVSFASRVCFFYTICLFLSFTRIRLRGSLSRFLFFDCIQFFYHFIHVPGLIFTIWTFQLRRYWLILSRRRIIRTAILRLVSSSQTFSLGCLLILFTLKWSLWLLYDSFCLSWGLGISGRNLLELLLLLIVIILANFANLRLRYFCLAFEANFTSGAGCLFLFRVRLNVYFAIFIEFFLLLRIFATGTSTAWFHLLRFRALTAWIGILDAIWVDRIVNINLSRILKLVAIFY